MVYPTNFWNTTIFSTLRTQKSFDFSVSFFLNVLIKLYTQKSFMRQIILSSYIYGSLLSRKSLCTCIMVWQISTKITEDMWSHVAKPNFWVKLIQKQQEVIIKVKFSKFDANWCILLWCWIKSNQIRTLHCYSGFFGNCTSDGAKHQLNKNW